MLHLNVISATLCCIFICICFASGDSEVSNNVNFQYFVLAQVWPSSACQRYHKDWEGTCHVPVGDFWTIHGLWPTTAKPPYPSNCTPSHKFEMDKIKLLLPALETYWPDLYFEGKKDAEIGDFWKHEYEKHGTCGESQPLISDEFHFFAQTLFLADKYNFTRIFSDNNILPSSTPRNISVFQNAFKNATGHIPKFRCLPDSKGNSHLEEIWLYLDKSSFNAIDVPASSSDQPISNKQANFGMNGQPISVDLSNIPRSQKYELAGRKWTNPVPTNGPIRNEFFGGTIPTDQPVPVPVDCNGTIIYGNSSKIPSIRFAVMIIGFLLIGFNYL